MLTNPHRLVLTDLSWPSASFWLQQTWMPGTSLPSDWIRGSGHDGVARSSGSGTRPRRRSVAAFLTKPAAINFCVQDAVQRQSGALLIRDRLKNRAVGGPGSAAHHSASLRAA